MTAVYYLAPQDWSDMSRTVRLCMASEEERDRKGLRGVNTFYYGGRGSGKVSAVWRNGSRRSVYDSVVGLEVRETEWEDWRWPRTRSRATR